MSEKPQPNLMLFTIFGMEPVEVPQLHKTKNADDITLPSHTGSYFETSFLINLLMGKCGYSCLTLTSNTGAIFPITWSGSTSNVGSSVATDFQGVPAAELTLGFARRIWN